MEKKLFEGIRSGLEEILAEQEGKLTLRHVTLRKTEDRFSPKTIEKIRRKMNVSQSVFAHLLNVSLETVRAWEQGKRRPSGPSVRLLRLAEQHPDIFIAEAV